MLADKTAHYEKAKESLYCYPSQYKDKFPWLREVDSLALVGAYNALEAAYRNFFRDPKIGFPSFKSKHRNDNSYTTNMVNGNITLTDGYLKLPKLGKVKVKQHRQIPNGYKLKSVTISQTSTGKYFASALYEFEADIAPVQPNTVIGLDFSMPELYVDSNGESPAYPRFYRRAQGKLAKEQRKLSKRMKGGKNRAKQRVKVAKLHEQVANQRKDFLHKQSRQIANAYDAVCIEDLNMSAMAQELNLGKSVSDNGWGMFTQFLGYKLKEQGKQLIKIDKWFPSSKLCGACGHIYGELELKHREWDCPNCNTRHIRDCNAASNIRNEGLRQLA
jgi:putative transposase